MKHKLTEPQVQALLVNEFLVPFDDEEIPCQIQGGSLTFENQELTWTFLVDCANTCDAWASYWTRNKAPDLARFSAREARVLGNLASKIYRAKPHG